MGLTYVGHATVVVDLDGCRLVTDPVLGRRVWHLTRRAPPPDPLGPLDAVLVSHGHYDHLDLRSLATLDREVLAVVPRGLGRVLRRRGFERVVEIEEGQAVPVGRLVVEATHAEHGGRGLRGAAAVGYLIRGSSTVWFAGDTGLFPELTAIGAVGIDLALLPVWGWGPRLGPGHLGPESAAEAARRLRPRLAVPVHWGTYASRGGDASDAPARRFAAACAGDVAVQVLAPGDHLVVLDQAGLDQATQRKPTLPVDESGVSAFRADTR